MQVHLPEGIDERINSVGIGNGHRKQWDMNSNIFT